MNKKYKCRLCEKEYLYSEMSEEHYPAKCVGNNDIVKFDIAKALDLGMSGKILDKIKERDNGRKNYKEIMCEIFDDELSKSVYPNGRTARTLCVKCNKQLGKYDESYKKFYEVSGDPKTIKGYKQDTKIKIIKSIYGKFLSLPETLNEKFDFIDFVKNEDCNEYNGKWKIYFVKRDSSTDIFGFKDIGTGKLEYNDGFVYELTDEKFIYDMTTIYTPINDEMNNIFDILSNKYRLITGVDKYGGYHGQVVMSNAFNDMENVDIEN